jgi:rhomboid protease GluP
MPLACGGLSKYDAGVSAPDAESPVPPSAIDATAAVYLAGRVRVDRGYAEPAPPEAAPLRDAADLVLTRTRMSAEIICIVDRDADPSRRFGLDRDGLDAIGDALLRYSGRVGATRMPVVIQIWEVGRGVGTDEDLARLRALSRRTGSVILQGWAIDSATGQVRTTAPFNGLFAGRRYVERVLTGPRLPIEEWARPEPAVAAASGLPWVTIGLLVALAAVFVAEQVLAVKPSTKLLGADILTLQALGGLWAPQVADGEWYRLITAAFLHTGILHLLLNGVALWMAGVVLERTFGRTWLVGLFVLGALGGSAASCLLNPSTMLSVGASGAIMGLLAAALVSSFRLPDDSARLDMQMTLGRVLVPSLIPLALHGSGPIDYAAHLGGAIVGLLVGVVLLRTWRITEPRPRFRAAAAAIAIAGAAALVFGAFDLTRDHAGYVQTAAYDRYAALLIPAEMLPSSDEEWKRRAESLVAEYPRDPRAHWANAWRYNDAGDAASAERELRTALADQALLDTMFPERQFEIGLRGTLADLLTNDGRTDEARAIAAPICAAGPGGSVPEPVRPLGVCP